MSETMAILIQFTVIGILLIPFFYLFKLVTKALKVYIKNNSK